MCMALPGGGPPQPPVGPVRLIGQLFALAALFAWLLAAGLWQWLGDRMGHR